MIIKKLLFFITVFFININLQATNLVDVNKNQYPKKPKVDYTIWDGLLKTYITSNGNVKYEGFIKDEKMLNKFLDILSNTEINNNWTTNEKIAYWINVYNAFTIKLIINNYPVNSIKEIPSPWKNKFFEINNKLMSLGEVEHEILRKFDDPRIHFAINCASRSCPRIIQIPYRGANLDRLLERQTCEYINNPDLNLINEDSYKLSKLFSWFGKDFKKENLTIVDFVNKYSKIKITNQKNLGFIKYDWDLNEY